VIGGATGCSNCGGRVEIDEEGELARCPFCASEYAIPRETPDATPVVAQRGPRDFILPALGCIAVYAVVFMVVSLGLAAFGLQEPARSRGVIGLVAIVAGVVAFVWMLRARRSRQRNAAVPAAGEAASSPPPGNAGADACRPAGGDAGVPRLH
jgi:hypothetical protein